jgi:hypothetical protein
VLSATCAREVAFPVDLAAASAVARQVQHLVNWRIHL